MSSNILKRIKTSLAILLLIVSFMSCRNASNHECLITNVNVVDVKTGEILKNKTVAIDSNRISAIYDNAINGSDSTIIIDGKGKYLIPGLWDMHAHYKWSPVDLDLLLISNGITGVREMWGNMPEFIKVPPRKQPQGMEFPDIYSAGEFIEGNPPSFPAGCIVVATPEEAINAVKDQIDKKVDFIKIYRMLSEDCFLALAKEAKKRNIPFAGHIPHDVSIFMAIESGMASSEHLERFLEGCIAQNSNENPPQSNQELVSRFSEKTFDSLCNVLAKSSMWICPTLIVNKAVSWWNDSTFKADSRKLYIPRYLIDDWNQKLSSFSQSQLDDFCKNMRVRYLFELSLIGKMNAKGVKFLAGTDFPNPYVFPGFSLHDELSLMVKGGMPALDALKSATINPAIFMNKTADFGSVEVGKSASLVLLSKNPLENIDNTRAIEAVIVRGKVYNRNALDSMLEQAKSHAGADL